MEPAPKEVQVQLNTLPKSFTASEIGDMYRSLKTDVDKLNKAPGMTSSKLRSILGQKHKIFQYSYPGVFMKTIMGELNEVAFLDMLDTKSRLDFGDIDLEWAAHVHAEGNHQCAHQNRLYLGGKSYELYGPGRREAQSPAIDVPVFAYVLDGLALIPESPVLVVKADEISLAKQLFGAAEQGGVG